MGLRHLVPSIFVSLLIALTFGSFFSSLARWSLIWLLVAYLTSGFYFAARRRRNYGLLVTLAVPFVCLCFHVVYGLGTLLGLRYLFKSPRSQPIRAGLPVGH
jgi:hypothetical protein